MDLNIARASARVPLTDGEVLFAEQLGEELRRRREEAGFTRRELGDLAMVSAAHLGQLEWGVRRTRRSTLERIAVWFMQARADPETDEYAEALTNLIEYLVCLAGPALAPESEYRDRVERRRERRAKKAQREQDKTLRESLPLARNLTAAAVAEYKRTGKLPRWMESR